MKILKKFWWVLAIGAGVYWYKRRAPAVTVAAFNGVPKYLDPASRAIELPGVDFSKPLY